MPGTTLPVVRLHSIDVAFVICEDLWQDGGPVAAVREAEAGLLVVINGSATSAANATRASSCTRRARETQATVAYRQPVGGQDELVFDGDSLIVHPTQAPARPRPQFEEHLLVADLELLDAVGAGMWGASRTPGITIQRHLVSADPVPAYEPQPAPSPAQRRDRRSLLRRPRARHPRLRAQEPVSSVLLGLSGGIDSALVATIAVDALGADRVHGVLMPSRYSTDHSVTDAEELARRQGINARIIPVAPLVEAFENAVKVDGLAEENLQARVRGQLLMTLSNQEGHLVLTTGNKSELAVGYSTLYGDSAGGFAPIRDVWKTLVWELARWRNAEAERNGQVPPIPEHSITKPPSAELRPGQLDTDSLPEYDVLDALLDDYVGTDLGRDELCRRGPRPRARRPGHPHGGPGRIQAPPIPA